MIMRTLKYFAFLFIVINGIHACNQTSKADHKRVPPNIILIMADDMGFECIEAYGSLSYKTPRIDAMASKGILFTNCISNPLCTPSRVKIMTGLHNYRNYEYFGYLDPEQYTFGHLMQDASYATCIVGKWQLNGIYHNLPGSNNPSRPSEYGFDEFCLWQVHMGKEKGERYADPLIVENGKLLPRDPDTYGPDVFADYACDFIERKKDSPFFLYYPMVLVHDPFVPTPDSEAWVNSEKRYQNNKAYFKDMVAYTDKIVGRIIDKLHEEDLEENTLIIFTGDNGTGRAILSSMPERNIQGGKGKTIDAGVHVPLLIQWPKVIKAGQTYEGVVDFTDFFATFADITGQKKKVDGKSLLPVLSQEGEALRKFAFVHYNPMWGEWVDKHSNQFVQNGRYKLYRDGTMFDIPNDFEEKLPLDPLSSPELSALKREMQQVLDTVPELALKAEN